MSEYMPNDLLARHRENLDAIASANVTAPKQVLGMTSESIEGAWNAARRLSSAKTISEVVEIQAKFARDAFESFSENEKKLANVGMTLMKDLSASHASPWLSTVSSKSKKAS